MSTIRYWIEYRKGEPIPEDMKFEDWQTFGRGCRPVYCWIAFRPGEPIPDELKFEGW